MEKRLFTSESVTEGHPDKVCDAVSDAILDACFEQDPMSRVACETASCTGFVLVTGEITTKAQLDIPAIVRKTVLEIGYDAGEKGLDGNSCAVMVALDQQSADIAMGVDKALEAKEGSLKDNLDTGAGDQGMMFGYATNETEELMPYPIAYAHKLCLQLTKVRKDGTLKYLRPDGKSQVSVEYDENGNPVRFDAVVLSTQHDPDVTQEQIHADIKKYVFDAVLPKDMVDENTKYFINPTGRFVIGGPHGDAGLTGRKIVVDSYQSFDVNNGEINITGDVGQVQKDIADILRMRHNLGKTQENDFEIRNSAEFQEKMKSTVQTFAILLASIASVSLLVGGIGIMNIMLVSVTERTKEIGIRMAIGARAFDIRVQFLIEALVLSLLGGLIGVFLGIIIALLIGGLFGTSIVITAGPILLSFGFSGLVGIGFGYYPAYKASLLNPIDALRYE